MHVIQLVHLLLTILGIGGDRTVNRTHWKNVVSALNHFYVLCICGHCSVVEQDLVPALGLCGLPKTTDIK